MFGCVSTWKMYACGKLHTHEPIHAMHSINLPRRSMPANFIGLITAKYLQNFHPRKCYGSKCTKIDSLGCLCMCVCVSVRGELYEIALTYRRKCRRAQNWTSTGQIPGRTTWCDTLNRPLSTIPLSTIQLPTALSWRSPTNRLLPNGLTSHRCETDVSNVALLASLAPLCCLLTIAPLKC